STSPTNQAATPPPPMPPPSPPAPPKDENPPPRNPGTAAVPDARPAAEAGSIVGASEDWPTAEGTAVGSRLGAPKAPTDPAAPTADGPKEPRPPPTADPAGTPPETG